MKRWLIPAALFALALVSYGGVQNWIYYSDASRHAAAYSRDANNQIAAECSVPETALSCERQIDNAAREDQRDEYDLYSQKAMALWTGIMGAMAVVGIALSGVGVYLIWRTWDATREAADNSRKTLRSFIAKERALLVPQDIYETQYERPDGVHVSGFAVNLFNGGHAPGTVLLTQWAFIDQPFWPEGFDELHSDRRTIIPEGKGRTPFIQEDKEASLGQVRYLVGIVSYETLEAERFTAPFSYRLERVDDPYSSRRYDTRPAQIFGMPHHT